MEVSGLFQAPAALPSMKEPAITLGHKAGRSTMTQLSSPQTDRCSDWDIPAPSQSNKVPLVVPEILLIKLKEN
jgi:hypothetical protein